MTMLSTILRPMTTCRRAWAELWLVAWVLVVMGVMGSPEAAGQGTTNLPVIVADFNHDGIPDALVPASSGATATIAFGTVPYGSFSSNAKAWTFPSACTGFVADAGSYGNLLAGDFNGDGFADLLFTCGTSTGTLTGVMLGLGDGTFDSAVTLSSAYANGSVLGDFNHDGKLDAVVIAYPNGIQGTNDQQPAILFFAGNGDGTFATAVTSPLGTSATFEPGNFLLGSPVAADVNGDGYPDLVLNGAYGYSATNYGGATLTISVFGNRKDGTFGAAAQGTRLPDATAAVGTYPTSLDLKVIAGSFTGRGTTDFVVPDTGAPGYFLVKNTSTATSYSLGTSVKTSFAGLRALAGGSFTGSGLTDLVVANGTSLTVLANDGTGNFAASYGSLFVPSTSSLFAVADANLDGYADLYTASFGSGLALNVNLVNGSATATSQPFSLAVGSRAVSANWPGNILFAGTTANGTQTVNGAVTATSVVSSKNPSNSGDSVTFTASVGPVASVTTLPTGLVVFRDGTSTTLGSSQLDGTGHATLTTSALSVGTHTLVAVYGGDGFFAASTSPALSQVVNAPVQVAPTLTWATPAPISYGTPLGGTQLNASATNASGAAVPGTYVYVPAAGAVLSAGTQTLRVTFTPSDQATYSVATASVSLTVSSVGSTTSLAITAAGATVTSVASGSVVTLTARVAAGTVPVTVGQVKFCDAAASLCSDIHLLGTAQLTTAGSAILRFIPGAGSHSYKAVFAGTGNDGGSASTASSLSVTAALPTTTTIVQSGAAGNYTLTATVASTGGSTSPTGTISFLDTSNGNSVLGSASAGTHNVSLTLATSATPSSGIEPESTATADFNGDGIPDIVMLNPTQFHGVTGTGTLTILLGKGDGTFTAGVSPTVTGADAAFAVGDFNNDGKADIAVLNDSGVVTILLGSGTGTFTTAPAGQALRGTPASVVVGDFNGDGNADLAVSNFTGSGYLAATTILLGNGDGTFTAGHASPSTTGFVSVAGDLNQDGKLDLVTIDGTNGTATVLLGNGDGTFTVSSSVSSAKEAFGAAQIADFNGDGKLDLMLSGVNSGGSLFFTLYLGNGDGTFAAGATINTSDGTYSHSFGIGDFNGDGRPDLAVADNAFLRILLNNGDGTFTAGPSLPVPDTGGPDYQTSVVADFNGDGVPDFAAANSDLNTVTVALTQRTATVSGTATGVAPVGSGPHAAVASYPGDVAFAASVSAPTSLTGTTVTPTLTWTPAVSSIPYGTPLGAQQLDAVVTGIGGAAVPGTFAYTPAAGTVLAAGTQTLRVVFTPASNTYVPVSGSVTVTVTQAVPKIAWTNPATIAYGTALSATQLNATVAGVGSGALAGVLTYTPAAGTVLTPGVQTLSVAFAPADAVDYTTATASVSLTVTGLVLNSIAPTIVPLGSPATTVTLTGSGFVASSVVQVNGTGIATTYVNPTTLTAIVPATYLGQSGALAIRVLDPSISAVSAVQTLTVAPQSPSITLTGPSVTSPGSQPTVTLTVINPYPLPLTATFSLSFASSGSVSVDDPAIQFAAGGRTLTIVVPANSTVVPPIQLQAGTDAGTITIPLVLSTGGVNVTPSGLAPVVIVVPATAPTLSTTTITRGANTISVAIHGFSNTREVTTATFHFVAAPGASVSTPDITAPVGTVFGTWFGSAASIPFGSTFTYTQVFNVSDDPKNIGSVQVTLTNGVGTSAISAAQ